MSLANIFGIFRRKPDDRSIDEASPASVRRSVLALFCSAVQEYLMEFKTTNGDFIHTVAFGKMMAYRQLAVVLGDEELAGQFDEEIDRILESRKSNKK
ncbi:MAG: hypothetical protein K2N94_15395 [Lachnospiraceae bacterium]|nr:hypothetical protein [Lachnospiraceae bacterium]